MTANMTSKPISIADVAARAGVSKTTVSHALSGRRRVSSRVAQDVRRAVADLGYVPKHYAAALRSGVTKTLGLLVPDIGNYFFAQLARGVEEEAERAGYSLILSTSEHQTEREARYLRLLRAGLIDGLIYAAGAPPDLDQIAAVSHSFPMVIVDERLPGVPGTYVTSDNLEGGRLAGRHLKDLGHRDVLYLGGRPELVTTQERLAGLREAYGGMGTGIAVRYGDYLQTGGMAAVTDALESNGVSFTAIFAGNDLMAIGAMEVLRARGYRVPLDVSLVGFDDVPLSAYMTPPLTTIRQAVYEMGMAAASELLDALTTNARILKQIVLPVSLTARSSTGPRSDSPLRRGKNF